MSAVNPCRLCLSVLFYLLVSQASAYENNWPASVCDGRDFWLNFSGLEFCLDRSDVRHLEHHNLPSPSLSLLLNIDQSMIDIELLKLDDQKVTGGLHSHLGVTPIAVFEMLFNSLEERDSDVRTEEVELVSAVMGIDSGSAVQRFSNGSMVAYAIDGNANGYNSLFLFRESHEGAVMFAGDFSVSEAEHLLSSIRSSPD